MNESLELISVVSALLGLIMMILFIVLVARVGNIKTMLADMQLRDQNRAFCEGLTARIKCKKCEREYTAYIVGRNSCPHCYYEHNDNMVLLREKKTGYSQTMKKELWEENKEEYSEKYLLVD